MAYLGAHICVDTLCDVRIYVWRTWEDIPVYFYHLLLLCCFLHITTYLVRVLTDDDCFTDEEAPPPCAPSAWLNNEIGGAVVRIYLVLRLMLEHRTNEITANAVAERS